MTKEKHVIFGIHVTERMKKASQIQNLLTEYGCNIKTRLGLHETSCDTCSASGVMLLEMAGDPAQSNELMTKLNAIDGVEVKAIEFDHD
jgi:hypothetical protein